MELTATPQKGKSYVQKSKDIMQRIMKEKQLSPKDVKKAMGLDKDNDEQ